MDKLNKRQIVILGIAALFVLYAVYELVIAGPGAKKARTGAKPAEIASLVNTLKSDLLKKRVSGEDVYIARRAEMDWNRNLFWDRIAYREFAGHEAGGNSTTKIVYSGYVEIGLKRMAIINGCEYGVGESLDMEGYVLKMVTPSRILIKNRSTGGELSVPIQE